MVDDNITIVINTFKSEDKIFNCLNSINAFCKVIIIENSDNIDLKKKLENKVDNFISTEIEWVPLNNIKISKEKSQDLINFFETLEEDEDVQNIYSNAKLVN